MTDSAPASSPLTPSVARVFDEVARTYDQSGVEFFGPVGARLVELLAPLPGERALDLGCGRGAVTLPLAEAVGSKGSVTALDLSPAMAAATEGLMAERGHLATVYVGDAADPVPPLPPGSTYDVVAASLVLFFLADPVAALRRWTSLVRPGTGRLAITTFGPRDDATLALDALVMAYAPPGLRDARTTGAAGPFADDAGVAGLFDAGGCEVTRNATEPVTLQIDGVARWERFSRSTGALAAWKQMPDDDRPGVLHAAGEILDGIRADGHSPLVWQVRYTVGRRA